MSSIMKPDIRKHTNVCDGCGCECYEEDLQDLYEPDIQEDRQYCPQCFTDKMEGVDDDDT